MGKTSREEREIKNLKKAQSFHQAKNYFIILIIVLTVIYIVDELASNVQGTVNSFTICDLFNTTFGTPEYDKAAGTLGLVTTACYLIYLVSPFYKSLADKYGRRLFLIINTLGMGVGMLISILSHNCGALSGRGRDPDFLYAERYAGDLPHGVRTETAPCQTLFHYQRHRADLGFAVGAFR